MSLVALRQQSQCWSLIRGETLGSTVSARVQLLKLRRRELEQRTTAALKVLAASMTELRLPPRPHRLAVRPRGVVP